MNFTPTRVEALAPDQASLSAGVKLAKAKAWGVLGINSRSGLAWGECQGSGSSPYKVVLSLDDEGYKCACPSRKFPCKHALGLMLLVANADMAVTASEAPDWAADWIAKRKPRAARPPAADPPGVERPALERVSEAGVPDREIDDAARERAIRQRERIATEREASVADGLDALDRWIADQLERGLVAFAADARARCAIMARRLVDAKAPALAARLDALPSEILVLSDAERPDALIEAFGGLHLLAEAYRRRDALPEGLAAEVRRLIGWSLDRAALMTRADTLTVDGRWLVVATRTEIQPDKLRRIETWLMGEADITPRFAVLIDFVPVSAGGSGPSVTPGERFEASLRFYPAATPLRAVIVTRGPADTPRDWDVDGVGLGDALMAYDGALAANPWLPAWPLALSRVAAKRAGDGGIWIAGEDDALPTVAATGDDLLALLGQSVDMVGLWDGRHFRPFAAATPLGPWFCV